MKINITDQLGWAWASERSTTAMAISGIFEGAGLSQVAEIDHREMPFTVQLIGYFHMEIFIFYFLSSLGTFLTFSVFISSNSGERLDLVVGCL